MENEDKDMKLPAGRKGAAIMLFIVAGILAAVVLGLSIGLIKWLLAWSWLASIASGIGIMVVFLLALFVWVFLIQGFG